MNSEWMSDKENHRPAILEMISQLYYERGFSLEEIANQLNTSVKRVRALINEIERRVERR